MNAGQRGGRGMALVRSHAARWWMDAYYEEVERIPPGTILIGETVRFRVLRNVGPPEPRDPTIPLTKLGEQNIWGAMVNAAARIGLLEKTGGWGSPVDLPSNGSDTKEYRRTDKMLSHIKAARAARKKKPHKKKAAAKGNVVAFPPRPMLRRPGSEETPPAPAPASPNGVYLNMSDQPLITRHRPGSFATVWGNTETVEALQRRVEGDKRPHAYLFTGPSGIGKTTLARIIGISLGAEIIEVDAASNSGVDAMRELVELGHYMAPGAQARLIIIDECHRLSRNAWDAMLKVLEEPPAHLFLALCTTEYSKVPDTIATRCHHVKLNALPDQLISDFLDVVLGKEGWLETINGDVYALVVQEALGSPRRALALVQTVYDVQDVTEAKRIIGLQGSASPLIQVLQILMNGAGGWASVRPLLAQLNDDDFSEAALILASRYIIGAMNREENAQRAAKLWELLAAFTYPVHSYDPRSVFYGAVGRILWGSV